MNAGARGAIVLAAVWLAAAAAPVAATPEIPYLTGRVTDTAEILGPEARARIAELLKEHEARTTNQVAVLTVPSLEGGDLEDYAARVFETWGLGRQGQDNGVLLLVAPQDRRLRIEVGYGLESTLTDLASSRIIRDVITPRLRAGDYDGGIEQGARAIIAALEGRGEAPDAPAAGANASGESAAEFFSGPDLPLIERILIGAFIFGIIGLFTVIGVVTPGVGWFLYLFLIPFWAMFPIVVVGVRGAFVLLAAYLIGFPLAKVLVGRTGWHRRAAQDLKRKGTARIGGFTLGTGGAGGGGSGRSWSSGGSSRSSFSGGGGRSGGGGASGSW